MVTLVLVNLTYEFQQHVLGMSKPGILFIPDSACFRLVKESTLPSRQYASLLLSTVNTQGQTVLL